MRALHKGLFPAKRLENRTPNDKIDVHSDENAEKDADDAEEDDSMNEREDDAAPR
jgi:hypothetical protein